MREVLHRSDVVAALLYDPEEVDEFVLVEQYRVGGHAAGIDPWLIDIVAGRIEKGQTPIDAVTREISEETGLVPTTIEAIGVFMTAPHLSSERAYLYCATVNAKDVVGLHGVAHEGEDIRPVVIGRAEALSLLQAKPLPLWAGLALNWLDNVVRRTKTIPSSSSRGNASRRKTNWRNVLASTVTRYGVPSKV